MERQIHSDKLYADLELGISCARMYIVIDHDGLGARILETGAFARL